MSKLPADYRVKKGSKNLDKYMDFVRELKNYETW